MTADLVDVGAGADRRRVPGQGCAREDRARRWPAARGAPARRRGARRGRHRLRLPEPAHGVVGARSGPGALGPPVALSDRQPLRLHGFTAHGRRAAAGARAGGRCGCAPMCARGWCRRASTSCRRRSPAPTPRRARSCSPRTSATSSRAPTTTPRAARRCSAWRARCEPRSRPARCRRRAGRSASCGCPRSPARRPGWSATPIWRAGFARACTSTWSAAGPKSPTPRSICRAPPLRCRTSSTRSPRAWTADVARASTTFAETGQRRRPGLADRRPRRAGHRSAAARARQRPPGVRGVRRADGLLPRLARRHHPHQQGRAGEPRRDQAGARRVHDRRDRLDARGPPRRRGRAAARARARGDRRTAGGRASHGARGRLERRRHPARRVARRCAMGIEALASIAALWPGTAAEVRRASAALARSLTGAERARSRCPRSTRSPSAAAGVQGPLDVYYYDHLAAVLGDAAGPPPALGRRSEVLAYEALNLVDGKRSVGRDPRPARRPLRSRSPSPRSPSGSTCWPRPAWCGSVDDDRGGGVDPAAAGAGGVGVGVRAAEPIRRGANPGPDRH